MRQSGATLVEFALVCVQLVVVLLAMFEFGRMILVYTTVANAARIGARYAIVHGSKNTGTGTAGPSGYGNETEVINAVKTYTTGFALDPSKLTVTVTYQGNLNTPGSRVNVRVVYGYDPWTILPIGLNLGTTSEGVITF